MEMSCQIHASPALPRGKGLGTHWTGGWVGLRAGLDAVVKRKYLIIAVAGYSNRHVMVPRH
jgi:hypothetical protein